MTSNVTPLRWYVIAAYSQAEWEAYVNLLARGVDAFLPFYLISSRRGRYRRGFVAPLFPGYLFAGLDASMSADVVKSSPGVMEILSNQGDFIRINPTTIEQLREKAMTELNKSIAAINRPRRYTPGEWVVVPHGPFQGKPAQINRVDKAGMVHASLGQVQLSWSATAGCDSVPASALL